MYQFWKDRRVRVALAIVLAVALLAAAIAGTAAITGPNAARSARVIALTQAGATATAQDNATQVAQLQAQAQATVSTVPVDPLAGMREVSSIICASQGSGCVAYNSNPFTTTGSGEFALLWVCSDDYYTSVPNAALGIQLFDTTGHQVDSLSEPCGGTLGADGIVLEMLPPGTYTMSTGPTTGPSWFVAVLEAAASI